MSRTVRLSHDYPFPPALVWRVVTDLDHLKTVTEGLLAFRDLPSGRIHGDQRLQVHVSLFGLLPYQPYTMVVAACDDAAMTFLSEEQGAGVKSWRHRLAVCPTGWGCSVLETIEIEAGLLTPAFAAWARFMYRRRHRPRLHILTALTEEGLA